MPLSEFDLIQRYFFRSSSESANLALGIGDDCALLDPPAGQQLAITTDTLVEGVHFLPDTDAQSLGYKSLAVNLSDLAAMGAAPRWFTLALTLPKVDEDWLAAFSRGLFELADQFSVCLIGGDTTQGPLSISITAMGTVPQGDAINRSGARPGDGIYVSGCLGLAGLGLQRAQRDQDADSEALRAFLKPEPRVELGLALRGLATACIDLSDGLASDLRHILTASSVGATIDGDALPALQPSAADATVDPVELALTAGDDYELCFTLPAAVTVGQLAQLRTLGVPVTRIGTIESEPGLRLKQADGSVVPLKSRGYEHFRSRTDDNNQ